MFSSDVSRQKGANTQHDGINGERFAFVFPLLYIIRIQSDAFSGEHSRSATITLQVDASGIYTGVLVRKEWREERKKEWKEGREGYGISCCL